MGGNLVRPKCIAFRAPCRAILLAWLVMALIDPLAVYGQSGGKPGQRPEGGRDPFLLPPGVRLLSPEGGAPVRKETITPVKKESEGVQAGTTMPKASWPFTLKAILISDRVRLASIDQLIVTVGDKVYDEKILEIHQDRVVLEKGNKRRVLLLAQSPVRLIVEEKKAGEKP